MSKFQVLFRTRRSRGMLTIGVYRQNCRHTRCSEDARRMLRSRLMSFQVQTVGRLELSFSGGSTTLYVRGVGAERDFDTIYIGIDQITSVFDTLIFGISELKPGVTNTEFKL